MSITLLIAENNVIQFNLKNRSKRKSQYRTQVWQAKQYVAGFVAVHLKISIY